jgi:hypothetical protein
MEWAKVVHDVGIAFATCGTFVGIAWAFAWSMKE